MIPEAPKAVYNAMTADAKSGPLATPLMIARAIAIATAVIGAIPTATTLYQSWQHGVPFWEVSHSVAQGNLWQKNWDCKIDYRALSTGQGARIDVGACAKSGDVLIRITAPTGKSAYEWIAYDKLNKASAVGGLMSLIVPSAEAAETPARTVAPMQLAQATGGAAGIQVVCQTMQDRTRIIRVINEGGKCFRESFSPFQGRVEKREEVPCNTQCPPAGKS